MQILATIFSTISLVVSGWLGIHQQTDTPQVKLGANSTISGLPSKTSLSGSDLIPIVDNSVSPATTKQITVTNASTSFAVYNNQTYAPKIGSTNITTLGTITTGTWNGTAIDVARQGTGSTSPTLNQVILGNAGSGFKVVSGFGNSGDILTSAGAGTAPTWTTGISSGANVTWTGIHIFNTATTTHNAPLVVNGTSTLATSTFSGLVTHNGSTTLSDIFLKFASSTLLQSTSGTTYTINANDTLRTLTNTAYTKIKETEIGMTQGAVSIYFECQGQTANGHGQIYINGIAIGTDRTCNFGSMANFTETINVKPQDFVQIYGKNTDAGNNVQVQNFRIQSANGLVCPTSSINL